MIITILLIIVPIIIILYMGCLCYKLKQTIPPQIILPQVCGTGIIFDMIIVFFGYGIIWFYN